MSDEDVPTLATVEVWIKVHQGPGAGREFVVRNFPVVIGRALSCDVPLPDHPEGPTVSRQHARLLLQGGRLMLEDMSTNGTWVNSHQLNRGETVVLHAGDSLWLGSETLLTVDRQPSRAVLVATSHPAARSEAPPASSSEARTPWSDMPTLNTRGARTGQVPVLELTALGPFAASLDGTPLPAAAWVSRKAILLLVCLVEQAPDSLSVDRLLDAMWSDGQGTRQAVQTAASRIRQTLRTVRPGLADPVRFSYNLYSLTDALTVAYDARSFEASCQHARRLWGGGDVEATEKALMVALDSYTGAFLEGAAEDWVVRRREALVQAHLEVLEALGVLREMRGDGLAALSLYQKLVEHAGAPEGAHERLLRCLGALGRRDEALQQFQAVAAELRRRVGVGPGPGLLQLREALVAGAELPPPTMGGHLLRAAPG